MLNTHLFLFAVPQQEQAGLASSGQLPTDGSPTTTTTTSTTPDLLRATAFAGPRPASGRRQRSQPTFAARWTPGTARGSCRGLRARRGQDGRCGCGYGCGFGGPGGGGRGARSAARPAPRGAGEGCPTHVTAARDKCPTGREPGGETRSSSGRRPPGGRRGRRRRRRRQWWRRWWWRWRGARRQQQQPLAAAPAAGHVRTRRAAPLPPQRAGPGRA